MGLEVFLARAEQEPQALQDHDERWLPLADPLGVPWLEADVPVVAALQARLAVPPDRDGAGPAGRASG